MIELPDIEPAWEEMSILLTAESGKLNNQRLRNILIRMIGLNILCGLILTLFAFLPNRKIDQVELVPEAHALSDVPAPHIDVDTNTSILTIERVYERGVDSMIPENLGRERSHRQVWALNSRGVTCFKCLQDTVSLFRAKQIGQLPSTSVYMIPGFNLTFSAFPEVRPEDWMNQFGAEVGLKFTSTGYQALNFTLAYLPISIRTLDLSIPDIQSPGNSTVRSYQRLNYLSAGIGLDQKLNSKIRVHISFQIGKIASATGSEILKTDNGGTVQINSVENRIWKNPEGIHDLDYALQTGIEFQLKNVKAGIGYRQSLRDYSNDAIFKSGTINSYGSIQFRLGYDLNKIRF